MPGIGTQNSPITIDLEDSEDEVQYNLTAEWSSYSASPVMPSVNLGEGSSAQDPTRNSFSELKESMRTGFSQLGSALLGEGHPESTLNGDHSYNKRKRSHSVELVEGPPPSKHGRTLEDRLSNPTQSKSSKKRQNKAEKNKRIQAENMRRFQRDFTTLPALVPFYPPGVEPGDNVDPFMLLRFNQFPPGHPEYLPPPKPYFIDAPVPPPAPQFVQQPMSWAESMAMGTNAIVDHPAMPFQYPPPEPDIPPPNLPPPYAPLPSQTLSSRPLPTGPKADIHGLPIKPTPHVNLPIGMKPDQDPNSKHGVFKSVIHESKPYIPNPARTLVMEQLPKSHRHSDFIHSWARKASGAQPLKVFIDAPAAKALVEFSTAEFARKAWESPRLGAAFQGLKSHQLKGKPREDLIRVWWYRVDGVGAGSGVGEIEEGEIEGDAQEAQELESAPRKETKKERKARLAKAREEKHQREQEAMMARETWVHPHPVHASLDAPPPVPSVIPSLPPLPVASVPVPWNTGFPHRPPAVPLPQIHIPPMPQSQTHRYQEMDVDGDDMEIASPSEPSPNLPTDNSVLPRGKVAPVTTVPLATDTASGPSPVSATTSDSKASEKEALKNVLAARHKELEAQISQRRRELAQLQITSNGQPAETQGAPGQQQSMDERLDLLRQRVLQSQKAKQAEAIPISKPPAHASLPPRPPPPVAQTEVPATPSSILEDMAVSFITETIETVKVRAKTPPQTSTLNPAPVPKRTASTSKAEVELKMKRLEQHIAQTKMLMKQLSEAKTKEEKDLYRAKLKELDRQQTEEKASTMKAEAAETGSSTGIVKTGAKVMAPPTYWPRFELESNILILSDDEDDD